MKEPVDDPWFTRTQSRLRRQHRYQIISGAVPLFMYVGLMWFYYTGGLRSVACYFLWAYLLLVPVGVATLRRYGRLKHPVFDLAIDRAVCYLVGLTVLAIQGAKLLIDSTTEPIPQAFQWLFGSGPVRVLWAALVGVVVLRLTDIVFPDRPRHLYDSDETPSD
jgi:hypothetical protein